MKILKLLIYFFLILLLGAAAFLFSSQYFLTKPENAPETDAENFVPEAKISAPVKLDDFEKTAEFGEINCADFESNDFISEMMGRINVDRENNNRQDLAWSELLCEAAKLKAEDMIKNNYFEHISPTGITPWFWIERAGYNFLFSGENLALNYYTPESAHNALMASPGHRKNLLSENFTAIGIAYVRGRIESQEAFIIVQHFASPAPVTPPVRYVCETEKAEKNLKDLKETKKKIEEYLKEAGKIKKEILDAQGDTRELDEYIQEMNLKKNKVKKYINEVEDYLKKCGELGVKN
jgi:uncharacterized protein YkwD